MDVCITLTDADEAAIEVHVSDDTAYVPEVVSDLLRPAVSDG